MTELTPITGKERRRMTAVHFERAELARILGLYARRVASGEWRDYAIDQMPDRAVFAVYRHTLDQPLFTIAKIAPGIWEVASGYRILASAPSLDEALAVFEKGLRLVAD